MITIAQLPKIQETADANRARGLGGLTEQIRQRPAVSLRAVLIGFLAIPFNTYWLVLAYWRYGFDSGTHYPIYSNCLFVLFLLITVNALVRRRRPDRTLATGELLTVYVILSVATAWCGPGLLLALPEAISDPFWYATPDNHWAQTVWPNLPTWLTVSNVQATAGLFDGDSTPYVSEVLLAWAGPALWWTGITSALMLCYACLSSILRRRWVEDDKLLFPMTTVPLQMAEERHGLWRSRMMWAGFCVAGVFELFATLHGFFPAVPVIPLYFDLGPLIDQYPPWNAIRWKGVGLWPAVISLCYLMPLDLAFSLWFFNLLWKTELIVSSHLAWTTDTASGFPYIDMQSLGGFIALLVSIVWLDRRYLLRVGRRTLGLPVSGLDESKEPLSYRWAVVGFAVGIAFICYTFGRAGMTSLTSLSWIANLLLIGVVLTRVRAQLGPPHFEQVGMGPTQFLPVLFGSNAIGPKGLGMLWLSYPFTRHHTENPQPWTLETYKLADSGRMELRRLPWVLVFATALAIVSLFWASLQVLYHIGSVTTSDAFSSHYERRIPVQLDSMLANPSSGPNWALLIAVGVGLAGTAILMVLKMSFYAWPLHPVALPIASAWVMDSALPAVFIAWLVKTMLVHYGGLRLYRQTLPFALGMIIGSAVIGCARTSFAVIFGVEMPAI